MYEKKSVKAGLRPKEEAMGSVPTPPPYALFCVFLLWFHCRASIAFQQQQKTKTKQLLCMLLNE